MTLEPDLQIAYHLQAALEKMQQAKPNDRSPSDRHRAIAITDLERVIAFFDYYVVRERTLLGDDND